MQRTRRDSHFDSAVRRALTRHDDHRAVDRVGLTRPSVAGEQIARWETDGGALGGTVNVLGRSLEPPHESEQR